MSANLDTANIFISLPQMLDLALGAPEIETINLNILHHFLHALLHFNDLKSKKVEYRGDDANRIKRMISSSLKSVPNPHLNEYIIKKFENIKLPNQSNNKNIKIDVYIDVDSTSNQSETVKIPISTVVSNRNIEFDFLSDHILSTKKAKDKNIKKKDSNVNKKMESVILTKPLLNKLSTTSVTSKHFKKSLATILHDFTKNYKIERQAGGGDIINQVSNKRLSEIENNTNSFGKLSNPYEEKNNQIEKKNKFSTNNNNTIFDGDKSQENVMQRMKNISEKQCDTDLKFSSTTSFSDQKIKLDQDALGKIDCCKLRNEVIAITATLAHVKEEICNLRENIYEISKRQGKSDKPRKDHLKKCSISSNDISEEKYFLIKQKRSNLKSSGCTDLICNLEMSLNSTIHCIEKRFQNFEEYVKCSLRNLNEIITKTKNEEELIKYVHAVRLDFKDLKKDVLDLQNSKTVKDKQNETFEEKLEVLKIVKADKDTIEEALMDKADICGLNKKVSHDQFDAVCDDLARSLNNTITKLNQQESIWQQSFYELRHEIEGKLNELEIPALKDFIKNELQALKNQLRLLSEVKREQEAAGAKKLLRNLRCISCDKDALMQTNLKIINNTQPFPCRPSLKPYLTFNIDQVRDAKKKLLQQKKRINLEKFTSENLEKKCGCIKTDENMSKNDFCNRYCGGSHTIISPQQRKTTLQKATKNCVMHSDVNNLHLIEGVLEGTDGRMYRSRWFLK